MKTQNQYIIYGVIAATSLGFLYLIRTAMMPFILAAGFAYLLNPLVSFLTNRARLPRNFSIVIIYIFLIGLLGTSVAIISSNLSRESEQFARETRFIMREVNNTIAGLPGWLQSVAADSFESARITLLYPQKRITAFLPGAVNRTISVLIFLVA